jgi:hypothetical protein
MQLSAAEQSRLVQLDRLLVLLAGRNGISRSGLNSAAASDSGVDDKSPSHEVLVANPHFRLHTLKTGAEEADVTSEGDVDSDGSKGSRIHDALLPRVI